MSKARPSDNKESSKTAHIATQKREIELPLKRSSTNEDAEGNELWERDFQGAHGLWGRSAKDPVRERDLQNLHGLWGRSTQDINGLWGRTLAKQGGTGLWGRSLQHRGLWGRTVREDAGGVHGLWGRSMKGPELEKVLRSLNPTGIGMWGRRSLPTHVGIWGRSFMKNANKAEEKGK